MAMSYLISTTNASVSGWTIYAENANKEKLHRIAYELFKDETETHRDIHNQTLMVNYRIVSKTTAKKFYKIREQEMEYTKKAHR